VSLLLNDLVPDPASGRALAPCLLFVLLLTSAGLPGMRSGYFVGSASIDLCLAAIIIREAA
jgi:hypothetical protein